MCIYIYIYIYIYICVCVCVCACVHGELFCCDLHGNVSLCLPHHMIYHQCSKSFNFFFQFDYHANSDVSAGISYDFSPLKIVIACELLSFTKAKRIGMSLK